MRHSDEHYAFERKIELIANRDTMPDELMQLHNEVVAEFDRLTAENEKLDKIVKAAHIAYHEQCVEIERLKKECGDWEASHFNTNFEKDVLQSWLDKMPGEYNSIQCRRIAKSLEHEGYADAAGILSRLADYLDSQQGKPRPADSQKTSEKHQTPYPWHIANGHWHDGTASDCPTCNPPKCLTHGEDFCSACLDCQRIAKANPKPECKHKEPGRGITCDKCGNPTHYWIRHGEEKWCLICDHNIKPTCNPPLSLRERTWDWVARNEKPTLCPECGGTGQKKVNYPFKGILVQHGYFIYERCPRCKGEGIIPKES